MLEFRGNIRYVDALKRNSQIWRDISKQFVKRTVQLEIRTFYETEKLDNMLVYILHGTSVKHNTESYRLWTKTLHA